MSASLRRRLLLNMLLPAAALALALGTGGGLLIHAVVQAAHDRLLDGSVQAIAERVTTDDGEVGVDLPPVALGMLETQAQDRIYYSVMYGGAVITGYAGLPLPSLGGQADTTVHATATYRGFEVRVAARTRRLYGKPGLATVAVAETTDARRGVERRMLLALAGLELGLLGVVALLTWRALDRGLAPLAALGTEIAGRGPADLRPLPLTAIPREVAPAVQAFNALLERLERSLASVQQFTGDAAHQLRTPLAVLRTHIELVRRQMPGNAAALAALDDAEGAARRLERMVAQLLLLARADEAGLPTAACDLSACVAEVVAEHVPGALAAGVDIVVQRPDRPAAVPADAIVASEIVRNLLDNAVQYNRRGGRVWVRVMAMPGGVRLEVEDDGPGIPPEERERVFERFHRIPRAGAPPGSGLGLAIVRALAQQVGAAVGLSGRRGGGLLATVSFPPGHGRHRPGVW